jgi:signal transduction histidine kinase
MNIDELQGAGLASRLARIRLTADADGYVRLCQEIAEGLAFSPVGLRLGGAGPDSTGQAEFRWPPAVERESLPRPFFRQFQRPGLRGIPIMLAGSAVATLIVPAVAIRQPEADLLADVIDMLGPVLHLARLTAECDDAVARARHHAERIAATRRQAFAERDQERRDLERDLHDGAQHHLVALRMAVGLLEVHLDNGDLEAAGSVLTGLRSGIEQAEQTVCRTAAGSCPPMLVDHGLAAALTAEFVETGQQVELISEIEVGRRYPLPIETAVYFTCLEAVNNARKHALGATIRVLLDVGPDGLLFTVTDDGPGLDPVAPTDSFGLGNMRSRIQAAGGRLELITVRGAGTTVAGMIPERALVR